MEIGCRIGELETPVLWVDLAVVEENILRLSSFLRASGVRWRPHVKGIKVPALAAKMMQAGAIGITCAKLSEAETMVAGGIRDVLIANQVVGLQKVRRLVGLIHHANVMVAIDDPENAAEISEAAVRSKVVVKVLIEVDIGINRCGVQPGDDVVRLAKQIADLRGIEFVGVMGWEGQCVRMADPHEKELECRRSVERLVKSAEMCRSEGLAAGIVSCGGSGTYWLTACVPGVTEIQAGGAVLNSATYHQWGVDLGYALFLSASIISHVVSDRVVVDAGRKALGGGTVPPLPVGLDGVSEIRLNAEHGIIRFQSPRSGLRPGERVDFVPGDDIVFLHDKLFGVRDGVVEVVWDVLARGKLS